MRATLPVVRTVTVTRYVTPLREGGSLPAVVEADDLGTYVLKFRGAGQGPKVLIAELLAAELGRALALPVPEVVFAELDPVLGRSERDPEIKALIEASAGLNLAMDFLPGAFAFDPAVPPRPTAELASAVVWFDALVSNVDRTPRNPNLLVWHKQVYLIDNGASFFFHYDWPGYLERARRPFPQIREHVLLRFATALAEADMRLGELLTPALLQGIVEQIPDAWLEEDEAFTDAAAQRRAYAEYLIERLRAPRAFAEEAMRARSERF
ncbi:MAG TPA: HipA family kinase [Dehalococcoidia bacterium]|nr:HipA family kinase [Dehalococcoidia bacterium]